MFLQTPVEVVILALTLNITSSAAVGIAVVGPAGPTNDQLEDRPQLPVDAVLQYLVAINYSGTMSGTMSGNTSGTISVGVSMRVIDVIHC